MLNVVIAIFLLLLWMIIGFVALVVVCSLIFMAIVHFCNFINGVLEHQMKLEESSLERHQMPEESKFKPLYKCCNCERKFTLDAVPPVQQLTDKDFSMTDSQASDLLQMSLDDAGEKGPFGTLNPYLFKVNVVHNCNEMAIGVAQLIGLEKIIQ